MKGKVVVITGGTGGIGRATALDVARAGAKVVVTGRDAVRGEKAVAELREASGNPEVHGLYADLASLAAVRDLGARLRALLPRIDVLLNNVGAIVRERTLTVDGIERTMAVNVLAPMVLTAEVMPLLLAARPSRVLMVCGGGPSVAALPLDDLELTRDYHAMNAYNTAKLANMAVSLELGRRLEGSGVAVHVVYPGAANTEMSASITFDMVPWFFKLMWPVFRLIVGRAKAENAARSLVWAASTDEVEGSQSRFFQANCKEGRVPPKARVPENVAQLWRWVLERAAIDEAALVGAGSPELSAAAGA
jgi:retinol dehydrogenase 14